MGRLITYRLLFLNPNGEVIREYNFDLRDDLEALELAERACVTHDVEIWQGTRLAARVDHRTREAGLPPLRLH